MFERGSDATTRMLSGSAFLLTAKQSRRSVVLILSASFSMLLILAGVWFANTRSGVTSDAMLQEQIRSLTGEVNQLKLEAADLKMKLAHEQATRQSLERDFSAQSEALKQATKNLAFYRKNTVSSSQQGIQ